MTEIENMSRDEMLEKLLSLHEVHICYGNECVHVYKVTQYTLSNLMTDVAEGLKTFLSFPSLQVGGEDGEWEESFTTVYLPNVCWIEWPDEAAKQMHLAMSDGIEALVDDVLNEEADEGEA